jgi:hypothetical protein
LQTSEPPLVILGEDDFRRLVTGKTVHKGAVRLTTDLGPFRILGVMAMELDAKADPAEARELHHPSAYRR